MPQWDRFDICEAYKAMEDDFNVGGILQERKSNKRRNEATHVQLARIEFKPGAAFNGYPSLSENAKEIYRDLCARYEFTFNPYNLPLYDSHPDLKGKHMRASFPGLYDIVYITKRGDSLCNDCADKAVCTDDEAIAAEAIEGIDEPDTYYSCDDCGKVIAEYKDFQ